MSSENKMVIITAPSGSGKTTIATHLLKECPSLTFSVSVTNRPMRKHEINGKHYFFISDDEFRELIKTKKLAEWEEVYPGRFYGTLKSEIKRAWDTGKIPLFDIDVNGALSLKKLYTDNALTLFIQAPDITTLENRLVKRGSESSKSLNQRITRAKYENSFKEKFDKIIINDNLSEAQENSLRAVRKFLNIKTTPKDA